MTDSDRDSDGSGSIEARSEAGLGRDILGNYVFSLDLETWGRLYDFLHEFNTAYLFSVKTMCTHISQTLAYVIKQGLTDASSDDSQFTNCTTRYATPSVCDSSTRPGY